MLFPWAALRFQRDTIDKLLRDASFIDLAGAFRDPRCQDINAPKRKLGRQPHYAIVKKRKKKEIDQLTPLTGRLACAWYILLTTDCTKKKEAA